MGNLGGGKMSTSKITEIIEKIYNCSVCGKSIADGDEYIVIEVQSANNTRQTITVPFGMFHECLPCYEKVGIPKNVLEVLVAGEIGLRCPITYDKI